MARNIRDAANEAANEGKYEYLVILVKDGDGEKALNVMRAADIETQTEMFLYGDLLQALVENGYEEHMKQIFGEFLDAAHKKYTIGFEDDVDFDGTPPHP